MSQKWLQKTRLTKLKCLALKHDLWISVLQRDMAFQYVLNRDMTLCLNRYMSQNWLHLNCLLPRHHFYGIGKKIRSRSFDIIWIGRRTCMTSTTYSTWSVDIFIAAYIHSMAIASYHAHTRDRWQMTIIALFSVYGVRFIH